MKKLQNDFTTPEQSKKLLAMGIPANTADLYYERHSEIKFEHLNIRLNKIELADDFFEKHSLYTPHWSVGRLMEIWDICGNGAESTSAKVGTSRMELLVKLYEENAEYADFSKLED